eukprot:TRINITY_DN5908_c0_g1_i6.p4 TRINITY_DN5908_c0_g1~~TRINITY_DN5908_c0_g1_i6.p4  ORF type:complete len:106 (-),score=18.82 TRINITY_DN5908_c0_g1_i6:1587-1904(-)
MSTLKSNDALETSIVRYSSKHTSFFLSLLLETNARAAFHSHIIPVLMRLTSHPHASVVTSSIFAIDRIAQHSGLSPSRNLQYIFSSHGVSGKGVFVFLEERFVSN